MYCLTNICYVCLEEKDKSLIDINTSVSVSKDIIHIIGYLPFDLAWLKTMRTILICEECCLRLRATYQFRVMCLKNSSLLRGHVDKLHTAIISNNEAQLHVDLNKHNELNKIKCEVNLEDEKTYTFERGPIFEETEDVFVNVDDHFVKEEDTWNREEVDDKEESPFNNNSTESSDNESDLEISVTSNTHVTGTVFDSYEFTCKQVHTTNKKDLNATAKISYKCLTCDKCSSNYFSLQSHTRIHTGEKPYKCATCKKCFTDSSCLIRHKRTHTGEKPYECSICKKCFSQNSNLVIHMRTYTGEKPYECSVCKKCWIDKSSLVTHMRKHTGEKPYECSRCKGCFSRHSNLTRHMRTHRLESE